MVESPAAIPWEFSGPAIERYAHTSVNEDVAGGNLELIVLHVRIYMTFAYFTHTHTHTHT